MDKFFKDNAQVLIKTLIDKAGFDSTQAETFVKSMPAKLNETFQKIDLSQLLQGGNISTLLQKIDVASLSDKLGMDRSKVEAGLQSLNTKLQEIIATRGNGLGQDTSNLMNAAKQFLEDRLRK